MLDFKWQVWGVAITVAAIASGCGRPTKGIGAVGEAGSVSVEGLRAPRVQEGRVPDPQWRGPSEFGQQARGRGIPIYRETIVNPSGREIKIAIKLGEVHLEFVSGLLRTGYHLGGRPVEWVAPEILDDHARYQSVVGARLSSVQVERAKLDRDGLASRSVTEEEVPIPESGEFTLALGAHEQADLLWMAKSVQDTRCSYDAVFTVNLTWKEIRFNPTVKVPKSAQRTGTWTLEGAGVRGRWIRGLFIDGLTQAGSADDAESKAWKEAVLQGMAGFEVNLMGGPAVDPNLPHYSCSGLF